jgi:hypothetical protein
VPASERPSRLYDKPLAYCKLAGAGEVVPKTETRPAGLTGPLLGLPGDSGGEMTAPNIWHNFKSRLFLVCSSVPGRVIWSLVSIFVVKLTSVCNSLSCRISMWPGASSRWPRTSVTRPGK